jgi:transposase
MPPWKAMWIPRGQQVTILTPAQPTKRYGLGAVDYHTGETVVLIRRRKRTAEVSELLEALLAKHPTGIVYVAWDNSNIYEDDEVEEVLRGAARRLVLLYVPTYSPWLNPIEMLWHHFRREVTHCEVCSRTSSRRWSQQATTSSSATTEDPATYSLSSAPRLQEQVDCT